MSRLAADRALDPAPFREWCERKLAPRSTAGSNALGAAAGELGVEELAAELGIGERRLHRWRFEVTALDRDEVEEALHRADSALWEVYGVEEVDLEEDAYCARCHDTVTPIDGVCPWCESRLTEARARRWCPREDRLVHPANNGTCWRCGTPTEPMPWADCACGCGQSIPRFDPQGRPHEYALGHAPRSLERKAEVHVEPFARYLEEELQRMDLLQALARAHGIGRDVVVRVLKRQVDVLPIETVRRAVWTAGRGGTGKGLPMRPDATKLSDLYPEYVRSKTCPDCGKGKAPHAALCRACRRKADRKAGIRPSGAQTRIRDELIRAAYERYQAGATLEQAAESIFEQTPHTNVGSTTAALSREWRKRGWPLRARTTPSAAREAA